jgi:hypothetical protein
MGYYRSPLVAIALGAAAIALAQASAFPGYGDKNAGLGYPGYQDKNQRLGFPTWGSGVRIIQGTNQTTPWRTYMDGALSRIVTPGFRIMRTEAEWQRYWSDHRGEPPARAPRDIDWNRETLVAIHLGERPTAGFSVLVTSVDRSRPDEVVVTYQVRAPGPNDMVAQMITQPFTVIRMQRATGRIIVREQPSR